MDNNHDDRITLNGNGLFINGNLENGYTTVNRGVTGDVGDPGITYNTYDYSTLAATITNWHNGVVIETDEEFVNFVKGEINNIKNKIAIANSYIEELRITLRKEICDELIKAIDEGIANKDKNKEE